MRAGALGWGGGTVEGLLLKRATREGSWCASTCSTAYTSCCGVGQFADSSRMRQGAVWALT